MPVPRTPSTLSQALPGSWGQQSDESAFVSRAEGVSEFWGSQCLEEGFGTTREMASATVTQRESQALVRPCLSTVEEIK